MKRICCFSLFILVSLNAYSGSSLHHRARGAVFFMNYCSGCHSLNYVSWSRMLTDLQLSTNQSIIITPKVPYSLPNFAIHWPQIALDPSDAHQWFGKMPPDLSLIARQRGRKWLADYLHGFYADESQRFGTNNHVLIRTNMPNILETLQTELNPEEFTQIITDITDFLEYAAEPAVLVRTTLGVYVVGFLLVLCFLFWLRQQV
jgi:ubiquinol-cytochrome c reductase cytochrome c1 subunit